MGRILKCWTTFTFTSPSRVALALRTECQERLFERRSPSTRRWSGCCKKVRKRLKSLAQAQFSPARGISVSRFDLIPCVCRRFFPALPTIFLVLVVLSMELLQVSTSSRTSARRLRGSGGRARSVSRNGQGRWARLCACGCAHQSGMRLRAACEIRSAPGTMCMSAGRANSGQLGPKGTVRGYGMLRAQNAKSVLVHHFLYLIVVCSTC